MKLKLPPEVVGMIAGHLDIESAGNLRLTSKQFSDNVMILNVALRQIQIFPHSDMDELMTTFRRLMTVTNWSGPKAVIFRLDNDYLLWEDMRLVGLGARESVFSKENLLQMTKELEKVYSAAEDLDNGTTFTHFTGVLRFFPQLRCVKVLIADFDQLGKIPSPMLKFGKFAQRLVENIPANVTAADFFFFPNLTPSPLSHQPSTVATHTNLTSICLTLVAPETWTTTGNQYEQCKLIQNFLLEPLRCKLRSLSIVAPFPCSNEIGTSFSDALDLHVARSLQVLRLHGYISINWTTLLKLLWNKFHDKDMASLNTLVLDKTILVQGDDFHHWSSILRFIEKTKLSLASPRSLRQLHLEDVQVVVDASGPAQACRFWDSEGRNAIHTRLSDQFGSIDGSSSYTFVTEVFDADNIMEDNELDEYNVGEEDLVLLQH